LAIDLSVQGDLGSSRGGGLRFIEENKREMSSRKRWFCVGAMAFAAMLLGCHEESDDSGVRGMAEPVFEPKAAGARCDCDSECGDGAVCMLASA
jgi:hypothetical protein